MPKVKGRSRGYEANRHGRRKIESIVTGRAEGAVEPFIFYSVTCILAVKILLSTLQCA